MHYDYLIVGTGLFGAVFAHEMKKTGKKCMKMSLIKKVLLLKQNKIFWNICYLLFKGEVI